MATSYLYVVGCIHHGEGWHSTPVFGAYRSLKKANKRFNQILLAREKDGNTVCWDIPQTYHHNGSKIREALVRWKLDGTSELLTIHKFLNT